jgi:hypothetical protein
MADFEQIPGELNFTVGLGDDLSALFDLDIVLTGYTFVAKVEHGTTTTDITITNTNLAVGQFTLVWTRAQIAAIGSGSHRWYIEWTTGSLTRRAYAGTFIVKPYP